MRAVKAAAVVAVTAWASLSQAQAITDREGWVVQTTEIPYADLIDAVKTATKANKMGVVTEAGPTAMAATRGITIPGNRVIGIFNNDFAVRILALSTAAMIEAPIRIYITENPDGSGTLSYKTPSHVFAPYSDEGGPELGEMATELDARFAAITSAAIKPSQ